MTIDLRVLHPAEWDKWYGKQELAFGGAGESPEERSLWHDLTEVDRSLAAWDGAEIIGTASAFSFRVSVPGGSLVPAAGLTMVSVAATHRRRGMLRTMMRRHLDDARELGEPLAVLTASEPDIYGRFGYGAATQHLHAEIDTDRVRLDAPPGADAVRLRMADPTTAIGACEAVYAQRVPARPGMLAREPHWERMPVLDPPSGRDGASPLQCVLAERDGEPVGYARYTVKAEWDTAGAKGTVVVRDVEALDPAAYGALLRFLFRIDLTSTLRLGDRPVDDPLLHLVSDPRRCRIGIRDSLYLRPLDVGGALAARTYATPVDVVLDVSDDFCPWNTGRWRLTGDRKGAACSRTDAPADLSLTVRELGAAYLGGASLAALADAGRVRELRLGALTEVSTAFGSDAAPWLPHGF